VKRALVMENISPQSVNAIKIIMDRDVSSGMNVQRIKIVVYKENVLMLAELHCQGNNAIVN